jgi:hypothetical protein
MIADYLEDVKTGRQQSLRTKCVATAKRSVAARNQALEQPALNLTMTRAYLTGRSPELMKRTWNDVLEEMALSYHGATRARFKFSRREYRFSRSKAPLAGNGKL